MADPLAQKTQILICVKCRSQTPADPDATRPGQILFENSHATNTSAELDVIAVECLSNCSKGCSVALRGAEKWSYVYGNLTPDDAELLLAGARKYHDTSDGLVPWRERPEHFRKNCIARIPPLEV